MFRIPLFDLNYGEEEEQAVLEILRSKWISTGSKCQELENLFCESLGTEYGLTTSSCTAALHLAVLAVGIQPGDEVIVPSLTFSATVNVVKYAGATPVFADVKSYEDLTIDPEDFMTEESELAPVSLYAETKVAAEKFLLEQNKANAAKPTCLRFSTVYGVSHRMRFDLTVNEFTRDLAMGNELKIFGEQFWRPYCHVQDLARSVVHVLESKEEKVAFEDF